MRKGRWQVSKGFSWLVKVWNFLTAPHGSVTELGSRMMARLASALAFSGLLVNLVGLGFITSLSGPSFYTNGVLIATIISAIAYGLSRTAFYRIGIGVQAASYLAMMFAEMVGGGNLATSAMFALPIAFLIVTASYSIVAQVTMLVIGILVPWTLVSVIPGFWTSDIWVVNAQVLTLGLMSIAITVTRNNIERVRTEETDRANARLKDMAADLEKLAAERSKDIERAAEVGRQISLVTSAKTLLPQAVERIHAQFGVDLVQVYRVDQSGHFLIMQAASGSPDLPRGHRLSVDAVSLPGAAASEHQPMLRGSSTGSALTHPLLPKNGAEMALPLLAGEQLLGVLDLYSEKPELLTAQRMAAFQILAGQLASALANADLFAGLQLSLADLETYRQRETNAAWGAFLDGIDQNEQIGYIFDGQAATPFTGALPAPEGAPVLTVPISVGGEAIGLFRLEGDHNWAEEDLDLANEVSGLVAQQVENLRLLHQAERYQREAQDALRKLTREEWEGYLQSNEGPSAFAFMDGQVQPVAVEKNLPVQASYPILVQNQPIGQFDLTGIEEISSEDGELLAMVGEQLGAHLENMRLYATAQQELSDRQRAEQALKESYQQVQESGQLVRTVIDSTADWIFIKDREHRYRLVNQGYANALHISTDEFIGKDDLDLGFAEELVKGDPERGIRGFWADDNLVFESGEMQVYPNDPATIDGEVHVFHTIKAPLRDVNGDIWGVLAFSRDVTEREELLQRTAALYTASRRLNTAESIDEMLRTVVDGIHSDALHSAVLFHTEREEHGRVQSADILAYWDRDGSPLPLLSGGSGSPVVAINAGDLRFAESLEPIFIGDARNDPRLNGVARGRFTTVELGSLVSLPLWVGDRPLGLLLLIGDKPWQFTDEDRQAFLALASQMAVAVENRRMFERTRQLLEQAVASETLFRETSEKLGDALQAARMAYWEFDVASGEFIFNDTFYNFLETTVEEEGGYRMPAYIFAQKYVHPDDAPLVGMSTQQAIETTDPNFQVEVDSRQLRKDGSIRNVQVRFQVVKDEEGRTVRLVGANQDVTERKRAEDIIARRASQLAIVAEITTTISTIQTPDEMLQTAVNLTRQAFDLYHAHIYLLNETGDTLSLAKGAGEVGRLVVAEGRQISLGAERSLVARSARSRTGVIVNDVTQDPGFLPHPLLPETRSEMAIPMIAGNRLLGVVDVQDNTLDRFGTEDVNIMTMLAAQVAVSLQNARSFARAQRQAEREALINAISERIQATNSVENALQVAVREIGRALGAQQTAVRLGLEPHSNGNGH